MASKIKVKICVTLDGMDTFLSEEEIRFDADMRGNDLSEATIQVISEVSSDVVKRVVEDSLAST